MTNKEFMERLKEELMTLTPRKKVYKTLKQELLRLGYWKNRVRGNPKQGYLGMLSKGK